MSFRVINGIAHVVVAHDENGKAITECGRVGWGGIGISSQDPETGIITQYPICTLCDCPHGELALTDELDPVIRTPVLW